MSARQRACAGGRSLLLWLALTALWPAPIWAATPHASSRLIAPPSEPEHVIQAGGEAAAVALLADVGFETPLAGGLIFDSMAIERGRIVLKLMSVADGELRATILLSHVSRAKASQPVSASFAIDVDFADRTPPVLATVARATASIQAHDRGGFYVTRAVGGASGQRTSLPPWGRVAALIAILAALAWLIAIRISKHAWRDLAEVDVKPTHLLPAAIQVAIFAYWALYWRELPAYLPEIALQIAFAYALDVGLSLLLTGRWRATAGPLPIVGSANLFIQFHAGEWAMQYAVIAIAMLSKALLVRQGRHVLNPSAFGIAVVGLVNLTWPALGLGDVAHQFDLPPNMTEILILLALVVQFRIPVVLISLGVAVALVGHAALSPEMNFSPFWSPVTLVVVLLATDPSTSPRSAAGKLLYGLTFGAMIGVSAQVLVSLGHSDFYGKVLPLPLCNLLVPAFDRAGMWVRAKIGRLHVLLEPRLNVAHIAVFVALMSAGIATGGKPGRFTTDAHVLNRTRFLNVRGDGTARCADNALFCDGFTFAAEASCWQAQLGISGNRCGNTALVPSDPASPLAP